MRPLQTVTTLLLTTVVATAADSVPTSAYATVEVEPSKTSIYIGSVTLSPTEMVRKGAAYSGSYTARVFPFFFASEKGDFSINVTEDQLHVLQRGEPVDFTGEARNNDGEGRRVEGRATPSGPVSGNLKVRIVVSKRIQLVFNTTYRFGD